MSRYLVVAPQGLGDSLEATPLVAALRDAKNEAAIDVLVLREPSRELFAGLVPMVSEVIYLPFWEKGAGAFVAALFRRGRRRRYDATFLAYPAARKEYHALAWLFPSRRRFAHRYDAPVPGSLLWMHTDLVEVRPVHNVLRNLDLLTAAGLSWSVPQSYTVPRNWIADCRRRGSVAIHVGSIAHDGLESRRWPVESFAWVATALCDAGFDVRAVMGPSEVRETERLRSLEERVGLISGTLPEVARALSGVSLAIANDSGIAHLAAAVRTPTIALFGPTPLEHAPFGPESIPLRPSDCPPCFDVRRLNTNCALGIDFACLRRDLRPELVIERALSVLSAAPVS